MVSRGCNHFNDVICGNEIPLPPGCADRQVPRRRGRRRPGNRAALEDIAQFLVARGLRGCRSSMTRPASSGIAGYPALDVAGIGAQCDLGLVVGRRRHHAGHRPPAGALRRAPDRHQPGPPRLHHRHSPGQLPPGALAHAARRLRGRPPHPDAGARDARRRVRVRRAGHERRGGQPRRHLGHGRTAGRGRRPLRGQPARRRPDRRLAHRLDRLLAVGGRPAAASVQPGLGAGADRAAHAVEPADRAARQRRRSRSSWWPAATPAPISTCSRWHPCCTATASWCAAPSTRSASCTPRAGRYFDTLRKKLHWNEGGS